MKQIIKIAAVIVAVATLSACAPSQKAFVCKDNEGQQRTLVVTDSTIVYDNVSYDVPKDRDLNGDLHLSKVDYDTKVSTWIYLNPKSMIVDFLLIVNGVSKSHHIAFCSTIGSK